MAKKRGSGKGAVVVKKWCVRNERACKLTAQQVREQKLYNMWEPHDLPDNLYQCPHCQAYDTRFDYYNNDKRDQPRFACRARPCKKKWTQGGKIRVISPTSPSKRKAKTSSSSSDGGASMNETRAGQGFVGEFAGESSQTPWQPDQEFRGGMQNNFWGGVCAAQVGGDLQNNFWGQLPGPGGDFATQVCRDAQNNDFWVQPLEFGGDCAAQVGGDVQNNFCGQPQEVLNAPQVRGDVQDNFWGQKLDDAFIDIGRFLETEFTHQFRALSCT